MKKIKQGGAKRNFTWGFIYLFNTKIFFFST